MRVGFDDIEDAYEFVNFGGTQENEAYLCKKTGKIYYQSEYEEDLESIPKDGEGDGYVTIPNKFDLNLGKNIVLEFTFEYLPDQVRLVDGIFNRKGAYSNFKLLLESRGMLEKWYEFESEKEKKCPAGMV